MLLIPTPEPRWLYTTYLDGNAQADTTNHGRSDQAVLLYAAARYALRRAALGRPEIDSGGFGENLAEDGLTEKTACIGYPCWKIDRRWGITGLRTRVAEVGGPPPQVIIVGVEEWEDRSGVITREAEVILLAGADGCPCALYVPSAVSRTDSSV